jgi:N-acetylglucosaminyldiphosphoundecaprenol N-acetyl-beta-D-mannosaminyltransferase
MEKNARVKIGSIPFDPVTMHEAVQRVFSHIDSNPKRAFVVAGANAHFVNVAERENRFAKCLVMSDLNVADGASIVFASRFLGTPVPERVTGIDLMVEICALAAHRKRSVYLLGGMPGAAKAAAVTLLKRFPGLIIAGTDRPPLGRESDPEIALQIEARIRAANPDFLFVCFGVPVQEYWIREHAVNLPVKVVMGNGAAFDILAGYFNRPPQWIQNIGCEWLYRLCIEPRRLWRRYLLGNLQFVATVMWKHLQEGPHLGYHG